MSNNTSRVTPYSIKTFHEWHQRSISSSEKYKINEVRDLDLIVREFKIHKNCCHDFTRGYESRVVSVKKDRTPQSSPQPPTYEKDDFDNKIRNKKFISSHINEEGQCISMKILLEIYGVGLGDTRYRSKLKQRLKGYFKDSISFLPSTD